MIGRNFRQGLRRFGARGRYAALVSLPSYLLAPSADAQADTAFELSWDAPRSCPEEGALRSQVRQLAPSPADRQQRLEVQGTVREAAGGFALELVLQDGKLVSQRRFEGDSCSEVVGAAAVAIALLLTGEAETPGPSEVETGFPDQGSASAVSDETSRSTEGADAPTNEGKPSSSSATEPESLGGWRFLLVTPAASVGWGFLSRSSLGLGAGLGLEAGLWRVLVSGSYHPELEVNLAGSPDRGGRVTRRTAHLAGCRWLVDSWFQLAPCATVALQHLTARGVGADVSVKNANLTWIALGPSGIARLRVSDWMGLTARVRLEIHTARPSLIIEGLGKVEQVGALEFSGLSGAEWIF